ncbi:MAG: GntR family transcriptional regulator [Clostridia bacterium]|nr:GntR family transcriptional regulator [Clostridia bacterium]
MYKYQIIYEDIKNKILNKIYKKGDQIPCEEELCKTYNVSRVTVNNALTKLKKKNYISRRIGSGSYVSYNDDNREKFVSFVMLTNHRENNLVIAGINSILKDHAFKLVSSISNDDSLNEKKIFDKLFNSNISGIICYPFADTKIEHWIHRIHKNIPIVFLDRYPDNFPCSSVQSNNHSGMYEITNYVIERGHKDIAYLTLPLTSLVTMKERFNGFCSCLTAHKLIFQNGYLSILPQQSRSYTEEDILPSIYNLMTLPKPPSVIICANDTLAHTCIIAAQTLGLRVPEDISITGFDDIYQSSHSTPKLTTMQQPFYQMGQTAAKLLCDSMLSGDETISRIYLKTHLIERESVKDLTENGEN